MLPLLLALGKKMPIIGDILSSFDESEKGATSNRNRRDNRRARTKSKTPYESYEESYGLAQSREESQSFRSSIDEYDDRQYK